MYELPLVFRRKKFDPSDEDIRRIGLVELKQLGKMMTACIEIFEENKAHLLIP